MGEVVLVDRIDVDKIKTCPHQMTVRPEKRFGVTVFVHQEDGEACSLLNSLCLSGDDLNREDRYLIAKKKGAKSILDLLDDPACYARLTTDDEMIQRLARELDRERSKKRLADAFTTIAKQKNAVEIFEGIIKVLGPKSRSTVLINVAHIYTRLYNEGDLQDVSHVYPLISECATILAKEKGRRDASARST